MHISNPINNHLIACNYSAQYTAETIIWNMATVVNVALHDVIVVKYLDGRNTVKWNRCADVKYDTKKWYVEKL